MSLEKNISTDLKVAMKAKDQVSLRGIRAIKSAILLHKTSGAGETLTEVDEIKILQKLVKQRQDSLKIYEEQNRPDLAATEKEEIEVISRYLPKQLSPAELETAVKAIIDKVGASGMKDMGKVMGMANKEFAGKADGRSISEVVKKLLA